MGNTKLVVFIFVDAVSKDEVYHSTFPVIVRGGYSSVDTDMIEDGLMSYIDSVYEDDMDDEEVVSEIMSHTGYEWQFVKGYVPACGDGIAFIYV